jgi:purine nucleosidase
MPATREPRPIVIDCDPGIDDALALLLAAASPELNLLAVSCVAGNRPVDVTAMNACRLLDAAGRRDVPVWAGCSRPIAATEARCNLVHGEDGLGGVDLPTLRRPDEGHAVDMLNALLMQHAPGTVTVIAMAPLTNLAVAEIRRPGLLKRAREVLVMGGAAFCPGNVRPTAEFNFFADPVAAHVVVSAGAALTLFGLDVTSQAVMSPEWIDSFGALGTTCGRVARSMLRAYAAFDPLLHDACPVAFAIESDLFGGKPCSVAVDWRAGFTEGQLLAWSPEDSSRPIDAPTARIMTHVDQPRLLQLVHERIARLR